MSDKGDVRLMRDSKGCKLLHKRKPIKRERKEIPFKEIKKIVWERDGWKCRLCGSTDNLTVHHIANGDDPDCLITVCLDCHSKIHSNRGLVS